jgi:hypothetical protein
LIRKDIFQINVPISQNMNINSLKKI